MNPALSTTPTYPACLNGPGDLTGSVYGSDRSGLAISFLARVATDHGTLWAATGAGRIFVTHNADATDPTKVTWHRIDNASSPTRYPSAIYVDPDDPSHAWVSYSGYNANTPSTPGHVFDVHENGSAPGSGTFRNLDVESATDQFPTPTKDGDLPVSDVVRDDATQTLYVGTDFGVLRLANASSTWTVAGSGLPQVEVPSLTIVPSARLLYAATHGRSGWVLQLP